MSFKSIYYNGNLSNGHQLEESNSLIVIRYKSGIDGTKVVNDILSPYNLSGLIQQKTAFLGSDVYIYECISEAQGLRNQIKGILKSAEDDRIIYVGTVMQFSNTKIYQIYTENIFLKFKDAVNEDDISSFFDLYGLKVKRNLHFGKNIYFVELIESLGREIFEFCADLLGIEIIEYCHPELVTKLNPTIKNHISKGNHNSTIDKHWWLKRTRVFESWQYTKGNNTIIAVIDDGIEANHPAFAEKIVHPIDMMDSNMEDFPIHKFDEGHGTACASIACSADEEAFGVAPEAQIMPIKITGMGSILQSEAFYLAVKNKADVISCSWGSPDGNILLEEDDDFDYPLPDHARLAFEYATTHGRHGKGCAIVFAAGNGKEPIIYDGYAASENVFAVSSININDKPTVYSDYGAPVFCCFPSGDYEFDQQNKPINETGIYVADRLGAEGYSENNYNAYFTGTSASCPGVAGIISLIYSINPSLNLSAIREILMDSTEKIGLSNVYNDGYHQNFGYGLLRADLAVQNTIEFTKRTENMETSKLNAVSLHIGINNVDQNFYKGFVRPLFGCVNDMGKMGELAKSLGYKPHFLKNHEATRLNIKDKIIELGNSLDNGGILMISYAGHGAPIPIDLNAAMIDADHDDNKDGYDESWVTYDGFMLDDEINEILANIQSTIRVVTVSDSCHSESIARFFSTETDIEKISITRGLNRQSSAAILESNGLTLQKLRNSISRSTIKNPNVYVVSLSACEKDKYAKEINKAGRFTTALLSVFNKNYKEKNINYNTFIDIISEILDDPSQNPVLTFAHNKSDVFNSQFPFSTDQIKLESNSVIDVIPKHEEPNNSEPKSSHKTEQSLFLNADNLLIETDKETNLTIPTNISSRNISKDKTVKISNGIVDALEVKGHSDWDKAYNLLLANQDKNISFIEPDTVSNLYETEEDNSNSRNVGDYLKTYPNAEYFNDPNYFTWHLDDAHSQLKSANEAVFPEIKLGEENAYRKDLVKIGHIDTGFLENHPILPVNMDDLHVHIKSGKTKPGAIDNDKKVAVAEQQGHGTATMGILAGNWVDLDETEGNFKGFFGAIPYAKVLPIKISETVALLSGRNFAKAVDYAVDQGCDVITMSMAGLPSKVMAKAVNRAYERGVIIVSAASNSFSEGAKRILPKRTLYPARYKRVIAATGAAYNQKPYLVRYQRDWRSLDRAAGGTYMQTCYGPKHVLPTSVAGYSPNISWFSEIDKRADGDTSYYLKSGGGTSSATPQVAAAAALYFQKYKKQLATFKGKDAWRKAEIVRQAVFQSADDSTGYNYVYGNGTVKALRALDPEFAPTELNKKISKAKKAPEKRRFLGGIFGVFSSRSMSNTMITDDSTKERLEDMMITEISQLFHKDENLFKYLDEVNFEDDEFSLNDNQDMVKDILNSDYASDFLKQQLFVNSQNGNDMEMNNANFNNALIGEGLGKVSISTSNMTYKLSNKKSYQEVLGNNSVWVDQFDIELTDSTRARGDLSTKLEISVDNHIPGEETNSSILIEKVYDQGSIYEWKFPDEVEGITNRNTSNSKGSNVFTLDVDGINTSNNRGLGEVLKRVALKVYKWVTPKIKLDSKLLHKVVAKFGDNRYEIKVFDLDQAQTMSADGWMNIDLLDKKKIYANINIDKKPVLVLFPGLFSTVESGFNMFLELPSVRKELKKKNGRYVLGINMPTVVQGIEANAKHINDILKGHLKGKQCNVLARSRGGIVARYLFEDLWVNNNTLKPTVSAPLVLNKLIMYGTPNQGTMMASSKNWKSLLNFTTNICSFALGSIMPVLPRVMSISKAITLGIVNLPGIDDLEEQSKLLLRLNSLKAKRDNYFIFTSNYEPNRKLIKRLFDELLVDRAIFKRQLNDSVTPVKGALFQNSKIQNKVKIKDSQYYLASSTEQVSHFGYLHPKHEQIIDKTFKIL